MQDIVFCERIYCMDEVPFHEQSSRYFGTDQNAHTEKDPKAFEQWCAPIKGTHHNAIGSDFVWCSNRKQEGLNNYTGSIPVTLLRLRYPAWIRRSPE